MELLACLLVNALDLGVDAAGAVGRKVKETAAGAHKLAAFVLGIGVEARPHGGFGGEAGRLDEALVEGAAGDLGVVQRLAGVGEDGMGGFEIGHRDRLTFIL